MSTPVFAGLHHLKLPVTDLQRSVDWYTSRLGYQLAMKFFEHGELMGVGLDHPDGGPPLSLRLDPEKCRAAAGFDYFSIATPDERGTRELAARLTQLGEEFVGVFFTGRGWVLPGLRDPDGHEVRFYSHFTAPETTGPTAPQVPEEIHDPVETAMALPENQPDYQPNSAR